MHHLKLTALSLSLVIMFLGITACGPTDNADNSDKSNETDSGNGTTADQTAANGGDKQDENKTVQTADDGVHRQIVGRLIGIDGNDVWILLENSIVDGSVKKNEDIVAVTLDEVPRDLFYNDDHLIYGPYLFDLKSHMERGGKGQPSTAKAYSVERVDRQQVALQNPVKIDMALGMTVKEKFNDIPLVDVREESEYTEGHLPGSKLVPVSGLSGKIGMAAPYTETPVMVYCRSGNRSETAAFQMKHVGYSTIIDLGGIKDYKGDIETGMPEE